MLIMVAMALGMAKIRDLFSVVILSGIFSLTAAAIYVVMDAVDVAFTEAAVGAGVSTVLMLGTLALTSSKERVHNQTRKSLRAILVVAAAGGLLLYATFDMPEYGVADAPVHSHVVPRYLEDSFGEIGVPNVVTSVLASYRGYDTLGEVYVIFTAATGVLALLGRRHRRRRKQARAAMTSGAPQLRQAIGAPQTGIGAGSGIDGGGSIG